MEEKDIYNTIAHNEQQNLKYNERYYEYETSDDISVVGRLKQNSDFWKHTLKAPPFIQNVIDEGYIVPFEKTPTSFYAKNNKSSVKHQKFTEEAVLDLLKKGAVSEVSEIPYCCNPLTVAEGSKLRLVLDLRHVNKYIKHHKFKYEDLRTFAEMFSEGDYFTTFDLKSGYHHIDIHPEHRKYFGFQVKFTNGSTRNFLFNVLAFGLSEACYLFTKVMRPFIKRWRGFGIKSIIYIDDGINGKSSYLEAKAACKLVISDLEKAGFVINKQKSKLVPMQRGLWLGIIINTSNMTFYVPEEKCVKLLNKINSILNQALCSAKQLAKVAGYISAMNLAIGPMVRLFTRNLYRQIDARNSWHDAMLLYPESKNELVFWRDNLNDLNGYSFKPNPVTTKIIFTDASDFGYGGFTCTRFSKMICNGRFSKAESLTSSTNRELLAVKMMLESFGHLLTGESIQLNIDNFNASKILLIGSPKLHLQQIAIDIFKHCLKYDVKLVPKWIPREQNPIADKISKLVDTDNWSIDDKSFEIINKRFGPFSIDRFADDKNTKTKRFNSKFYCPRTGGVNAFCFDWKNENNWLCPPVSLIGATIRHLKLCKSRGTLLIPVWPSATFWPLIYPNGTIMDSSIKDFIVVKPSFVTPVKDIIFKNKKFDCIALLFAY